MISADEGSALRIIRINCQFQRCGNAPSPAQLSPDTPEIQIRRFRWFRTESRQLLLLCWQYDGYSAPLPSASKTFRMTARKPCV